MESALSSAASSPPSNPPQWLSRTAILVQEAFYLYASLNYGHDLTHIEYHGNTLIAYGDYSKTLQPYSEGGIPNLPQRDREALLAFMACGRSCAHMHDLLKDLSKGYNVTIHEVDVFLRPVPRPMIHVYPKALLCPNHGEVHLHRVLGLLVSPPPFPSHNPSSMPSDHQEFDWALDLTAAQFGYTTPSLMPWSEFMHKRAKGICVSECFGTAKQVLSQKEGLNPSSQEGKIRIAHNLAMRRWSTAVSDWTQRSGLTGLNSLLDVEEKVFEKKKVELLCFVGKEVREYLAWKRERGELCSNVDEAETGDGKHLE